MKNTSKFLYLVGFIINIILIVIFATFLTLLCISLNNQELIETVAKDAVRTVEYVINVLTIAIVIFAAALFISAVTCVITIIARRNLEKKTGHVSPHVILLILGLISFNILYLIGAILGMSAASEDDMDDDD